LGLSEVLFAASIFTVVGQTALDEYLGHLPPAFQLDVADVATVPVNDSRRFGVCATREFVRENRCGDAFFGRKFRRVHAVETMHGAVLGYRCVGVTKPLK
jgi:hypothetical protein